ncbi:MAG TPA: hypothetical protein VMH81_20215, partial [Bryobacteraceae bacterium]|nr:hypothetical protein [Bryobacteraceae bacterium]
LLAAVAVVLLTLILILIPSQMFARFLVGTPSAGGMQSGTSVIVGNITGFLPVYLALWVWLRLSGKRRFWTLGLERKHAFRRALSSVDWRVDVVTRLQPRARSQPWHYVGRIPEFVPVWNRRGSLRSG